MSSLKRRYNDPITVQRDSQATTVRDGESHTYFTLLYSNKFSTALQRLLLYSRALRGDSHDIQLGDHLFLLLRYQILPSTLVDEEMANATTGIQTANQVHTADQSSEPTHALAGQDPDGRAAEPILGGTVAPRATGRRNLSVEGVTGTATNCQRCRWTCCTTTAKGSSVEEGAFRAGTS
jgi:hypothetical protein